MDTMVKLLSKYQSRIAIAIDAGDLSIVVESLTDIPTVPFMAILEDSKTTAECVWVTAVATASKTLTVTRAHRGTTDVAHVAGVLLHHSEVALADLGFFEVWETAGEKGRPFESQLITNVLLGNYANAIKGYVDCDLTGGSTGLLSGVNGEIRLPNAAARGAYFALEGEVVVQENSRITPWGSSAGFLYFGISGHVNGVDDFDDDGRFMVIMGLSPGVGHLLSLDYHTLRCTLDLTMDKYLVLSLAENHIYHNFGTLGANDRMAKFVGDVESPLTPDTQGFFEVGLTISGVAGGSCFTTGMKLAPGANCTMQAGANYGVEHLVVDQITNEAATIAGAVCIGRYSMLLDEAPDNLNIWQLNFLQTVDAIFFSENPTRDLGYTEGTDVTNVVGSIPFFRGGPGTRWIRLYSDPAA